MKSVEIKRFTLAALGALSLGAASVHAQAIPPQGDPAGGVQPGVARETASPEKNQISQAQAAPSDENLTAEREQRDAVDGSRSRDNALQYENPTGSNASTGVPNRALQGRPPYALGQAQ